MFSSSPCQEQIQHPTNPYSSSSREHKPFDTSASLSLSPLSSPYEKLLESGQVEPLCCSFSFIKESIGPLFNSIENFKSRSVEEASSLSSLSWKLLRKSCEPILKPVFFTPILSPPESCLLVPLYPTAIFQGETDGKGMIFFLYFVMQKNFLLFFKRTSEILTSRIREIKDCIDN
ncbi:hypothetical protein KY290_020246 [Solanum tuberosum]|uniref:Uncharacterized protein n=1 Tax=Solanum tuberosum TaxID=4113 RepID=A0ABQ7UY44_SOLTU|nr:hypothetical protein KY289_022212 [Solanum tuberosum]KAH0756753.1 hypothetical protein KY290_020246 [Solanum tuberosum]